MLAQRFATKAFSLSAIVPEVRIVVFSRLWSTVESQYYFRLYLGGEGSLNQTSRVGTVDWSHSLLNIPTASNAPPTGVQSRFDVYGRPFRDLWWKTLQDP
ncbi:hypothetical protein SAMN05444414_10626 [Roseovarius marisflavi]|uniref:Uncharacterized protein n=1 Tax=Roseovarius marisflavi TaxID=1054996 RepID=A0A1M6Y925_9RHOB|nr:hypothetical protein SAMN05444414_10626 [Roseovarius marisflavi]